MSRTIDVHNHLYPEEWMDYLEQRNSSPRMERREGAILSYAHNVLSARITDSGHYDLKKRINDMDRCGIDTQVVSLTLPAVEELPIDEGVKWARKINDYFAEVCHTYAGRFYAFATLPLQDINESVKEMERCHRELGLKGIAIFSNVNFKPLFLPEFHPIYAKAEECGFPVFIHPAVPFTGEIMHKHMLPQALYGFTIDTTMAVMSLIWQGVLDKYPELNIIHAHLGGMVPYLVQRMEDCWKAHTELSIGLPHSPSFYYKRQVYPDTMSRHLPAMQCCLEMVGPERMCIGTDYPHRIGNWEEAISDVRNLHLSEKDTDKILGGNAARICNIAQ